ncbi:MAG: hypothetical protein ABI461_01100 [Polyangiaceae bacterium]
MSKKLLRTKEHEIAKAGRMVFDAIFGDEGELEKKVEQELADEERDSTARGEWKVVDAEGHTLLRCDVCGRELVMLGSVNVALAEQHGWHCSEDKWKCRICNAK